MHQSFYDAAAGTLFLRFHGPVIGAETQTATFQSVSELDDPSTVRGLLLDYREVTEMDMSDSDVALFTINLNRIRTTGIHLEKLAIARVSDPTRRDVVATLDRRMAALKHVHGSNPDLFQPHAQKTEESQLAEAFQILGLPKDYRLPY